MSLYLFRDYEEQHDVSKLQQDCKRNGLFFQWDNSAQRTFKRTNKVRPAFRKSLSRNYVDLWTISLKPWRKHCNGYSNHCKTTKRIIEHTWIQKMHFSCQSRADLISLFFERNDSKIVSAKLEYHGSLVTAKQLLRHWHQELLILTWWLWYINAPQLILPISSCDSLLPRPEIQWSIDFRCNNCGFRKTVEETHGTNRRERRQRMDDELTMFNVYVEREGNLLLCSSWLWKWQLLGWYFADRCLQSFLTKSPANVGDECGLCEKESKSNELK